MTRASPEELRGWMREHSGRLLSLVQSFADGPVEAEDLLQETWEIAWINAHKRREGSPLGAWLCQVALNVGRQHARRRRRRRNLMGLRGPVEEPTTGGPAPSLERGQLNQHVWRAVAELPRLQQQVVLRRIVHDMSTKETADDIQRSEGTVKASLHRALKTLRRELGDTWPGP